IDSFAVKPTYKPYMNSRKIALSIIGGLLIIGSFFGAKYIVNSKTTPKPRPEKVVKTVMVET
ncbi:unnamed protein product, partial [Scytosiphon promiscuus]